jgi:restriction system protein
VLGLVWIVVSRIQHVRLWSVINSAHEVADLRKVSPSEFEKLVAEWYQALGHRARRVGGQGDHGIDVVVDTTDGQKWIVQCKRWKGDVGEPVVRDFYGALHHEGADRGAIITTGRFTPQAKSWAKGKPLDLYEGSRFLSELKKARAHGQHEAAATAMHTQPLAVPAAAEAVSGPRCPKCGVPMVVRVACKGSHQGERFYGCPNYPQCRELITVRGTS